MKSSQHSSSDLFLLSQASLRSSAIAARADSLVCFHTARYSPLPRESLATAVLSGYYNVPHDSILYSLPCHCVRDWLWDENEEHNPDKYDPELRNSCKDRLLVRLGWPEGGCYRKVVIGRWLVALFLWKEGESAPTSQEVCRREALCLTTSLLDRVERDKQRGRTDKILSARTRRTIAELAPERLTGFPARFCEYLESLATELVRVVWPSDSFEVSASVHLFQSGGPRDPKKNVNPDGAKVLKRIVELRVHEADLGDILRGNSEQDEDGIVLRHCASIGIVNPLDSATESVESICAPVTEEDPGGFSPHKRHGKQSSRLIHHASCSGEAYYLYDYYDRLQWKEASPESESEIVDHTRLPDSVQFLADIHPLVKKRQSDAVDLILPLVDDDGEYCIGSVNIEGVASRPYLNPMRIYLAQHIARSATLQIRKMRYRQAIDSIREAMKDILENNLEEDAVLREMDKACGAFGQMVDNRTLVEFYELSENKPGRNNSGAPIQVAPNRWKEVGNNGLADLISRIGYTCNRDVSSDGDNSWWGLRFDKNAGKWGLLEYRYCGEAGPRVTLLRDIAEWPNHLKQPDDGDCIRSLVDCCDACDPQENNLLLIPLFAPYGTSFGSGSKGSLEGMPHYCAGVLLLKGPQSWKEKLGNGDVGRLITEFKNLVTLLQRSRMQPMAMCRAEMHERTNDVDLKNLLDILRYKLNRYRDDHPKYTEACKALAYWLRILRIAFNDLPDTEDTFFNNTLWDEIAWLQNPSASGGQYWDAGRMVALDNFLRNAASGSSWSGDGWVELQSEIPSGGLKAACHQINWYPYGKPGHGRFNAHLLLRRYSDATVEEELVVGNGDRPRWRVVIKPSGPPGTGGDVRSKDMDRVIIWFDDEINSGFDDPSPQRSLKERLEEKSPSRWVFCPQSQSLFDKDTFHQTTENVLTNAREIIYILDVDWSHHVDNPDLNVVNCNPFKHLLRLALCRDLPGRRIRSVLIFSQEFGRGSDQPIDEAIAWLENDNTDQHAVLERLNSSGKFLTMAKDYAGIEAIMRLCEKIFP